jgi:ubiquinone biosynthesis protein
LLQKTMLEAEGTARSLCPQANMWMLTRPLIEEWMNEGAEERILEAIDDVAATVRHLPRLMDGVEKSAAMLAGGRLKLHPETVRDLKSGSGSQIGLPTLALVIVLLGALASLLF